MSSKMSSHRREEGGRSGQFGKGVSECYEGRAGEGFDIEGANRGDGSEERRRLPLSSSSYKVGYDSQ